MNRFLAITIAAGLGLLVSYVVFSDLYLSQDAGKCISVGGVPVLTWGEHQLHARKVACIKATSLQYVPM